MELVVTIALHTSATLSTSSNIFPGALRAPQPAKRLDRKDNRRKEAPYGAV
jgi:hypothetical protein